ncbi:MAG: hypothetical protein COW58_07010 [Thalassolituus sp. CG17_big_fil_post_rev_8_21_14_2_50_53_8]|nr:MAG: hypothetical protein COW58_07010 [Thalassolituus sp. CG17_big_fil_post_rev_8_21_14_2_50_53_8]
MKSLEEQIAHLEKKGKKTRSLLKIFWRSLQAFKNSHGRTPELNPPKTFNEKLLYRKLFQRSKLLAEADMVCKYEVRDYVKRKIGEKYLIPLINVIYNSKDFKLEDLPEKFIMKASHGSGWNYIVRDKSSESESTLRRLIAAWLNCNYSISFTGEAQYEKVKPAVVIEELMEDNNGKVPADYKFHCFGKGGKDKIIIQLISDRFEDKAMSFLTEDWKMLELKFNDYPNHASFPEKPENLNEMLKVTRALSQDHDYCRIDLYSFKERVFFGEITFVPGNSTEQFKPETMDRVFGDWMSDFDLEKDPIIKRFIR